MNHKVWVLTLMTPWLLAGAPQVHGEEGLASWYSTEACRLNPDPRCPTASGHSLYALERQGVRFAAMWKVPLGSTIRVCRVSYPSACTTVMVLDRGPAQRLGRVIDLAKKAFEDVTELREGVVRVSVERVP